MCKHPPPSQPHHRVGAGMGMRSHDAHAIPLCPNCHRCFHDISGPFRGFDREMLYDFHTNAVFQVLKALVLELEWGPEAKEDVF